MCSLNNEDRQKRISYSCSAHKNTSNKMVPRFKVEYVPPPNMYEVRLK